MNITVNNLLTSSRELKELKSIYNQRCDLYIHRVKYFIEEQLKLIDKTYFSHLPERPFSFAKGKNGITFSNIIDGVSVAQLDEIIENNGVSFDSLANGDETFSTMIDRAFKDVMNEYTVMLFNKQISRHQHNVLILILAGSKAMLRLLLSVRILTKDLDIEFIKFII